MRRPAPRATRSLECPRCHTPTAVFWASDGRGAARHRCVACGTAVLGPFPGELRAAQAPARAAPRRQRILVQR
jgi:ribosomal protein S27E